MPQSCWLTISYDEVGDGESVNTVGRRGRFGVRVLKQKFVRFNKNWCIFHSIGAMGPRANTLDAIEAALIQVIPF